MSEDWKYLGQVTQSNDERYPWHAQLDDNECRTFRTELQAVNWIALKQYFFDLKSGADVGNPLTADEWAEMYQLLESHLEDTIEDLY